MVKSPRWLAAASIVVSTAETPAQWVQFTDQTATRLVAPAELGANDVEEKDYAWGDVDRDSDTDLVVVRKEPFITPGRRTNVLFLNENGVLVDRTAQYATASDVPGDQGFLTPTNDRDVVVVDVDGDGWLDIVTAVTLSDGLPKHIGHPRVYINLREDGGGNWLGFRYEEDRIPQLASSTGGAGLSIRASFPSRRGTSPAMACLSCGFPTTTLALPKRRGPTSTITC